MLSCRGDEATRRWRIGASSAASRTELILGDENGLFGRGPLTPRLTRRSLSGSLEYHLDKSWTFAGAIGATVGGDLELGGEDHELAPGFLAVISASRALTGMAPYFVITGLSVGVSSTPTRSAPGDETDGQLTAGDVRFSVTAGRLFLDTIAPYAALRAFGGPVIWQRDDLPLAGGTDRYHVQVGLGLLVATPSGFDAFVELAPAGERAVTVGMGSAF